MSTLTEITVRPTSAVSLSRPEKPIFGVYTPGDRDDMTLGEVAKGLNPIHHIPFVSQLYDSSQEAKASPAIPVGKLIGGALLGGPIGFFAALANVVFEQTTGESMVAAAGNAIFGKETTQVASAASTSGSLDVSSLRGVDTPTQEILPPESAADKVASAADAAHMAQEAQMQMASAMAEVGKPYDSKDSDVLSLFGGQPLSAHQSYKKAQMLPYLKDVTSSQVI